MFYIFLAILYFVLIYLLLIVFCVFVYSAIVILMIIGVEINKTFMCCFEACLDALFHPCSCLLETSCACYACCCKPSSIRPFVVDYATPVVPPPPPKEIEMVVIVNPNGIPLQIGAESV